MRPQALFEHALTLLLHQDMAGFTSLWAEDGVLDFPFADNGYPSRLEGRDAIWDYLRDYPSLFDVTAVAAKTLHETTDPRVIIVEFTLTGTAVTTQRPYELSYVAVITVEDGEIQHYRDYWSPLAAAKALGGRHELEAFSGAGRE